MVASSIENPESPLGRWSQLGDATTVYCNIRSLDLAIEIDFGSNDALMSATDLLLSTAPPIRMPPFSVSDQRLHRSATRLEVVLEARTSCISVQFRGAVQTPPYELEPARFHQDFWKVLFATVVSSSARSRDAIVFHASCAATDDGRAYLVPGHSGSGKTAVAAAFGSGSCILSTELAIVCQGKFITGNFNSDENSKSAAGRFVPDPDPPVIARVDDSPFDITEIVFPVLRDQPLQVTELGAARVRALLFENAISLTGVALMVCHDTIPLAMAPSRRHLDKIAAEVAELAQRPAATYLGRADDIAARLGT